jgi:SAM-dependent methyltransferase
MSAPATAHTVKRPCPICASDKIEVLFRQRFEAVGNVSLMSGYDVVCCQQCGFVYADGIPEKSVFDNYYSQASKYEFAHSEGQQHSSEVERLKSLAEWIHESIPLKSEIIDVGCATGELLAQLMELGYQQLTGLDPSSACVQYARRVHGLNMIEGVLESKPQGQKPFETLILSAVLEHIPELNLCVEQMMSWVTPTGNVILEVPDAEFFADGFNAPFQEFSVEHINFFTAASMTNLMQKYGFKPVAERHYLCKAANGVSSPVLTMIFQGGQTKSTPHHESNSKTGIEQYIQKCQAWVDHEAQTIHELVEKQLPILVWGTGTLCQRLLATTEFKNANILAFIDSNPHYQGLKFHERPVLSPKEAQSRTETILIASWGLQEEIMRQIQQTLGMPNPLLTLKPVI